MNFAAALSNATDRVYASAGVAARHEDSVSVQTSVTVLVERDLSRYGEAAQVSVRTAMVGVRRSELADCPRRGDTFTLLNTDGSDGEVLTVDSLQRADELEHRVYAS